MDKYVPFILIPIIGVGVWRLLKKKDNLTPLKKRTFFIGMCAWILTEIGRSFYRPYIYENKIDDYFFADTLGNSFGTVTAIFIIITLSGSGTQSDWKIFFILIGGLLFYEFLNLTGKTSIDLNDMLATLLFGFISALIYSRLLKIYGNPTEDAHNKCSVKSDQVSNKTPTDVDPFG